MTPKEISGHVFAGPFRPFRISSWHSRAEPRGEKDLTMITPRTILEYITAEPFQPFRLHMAGNRTFEVPHPEMIKVGKSSVTLYSIEDESSIGQRRQEVSLMLLESIEPIEPAKTSKNGSQNPFKK